MVYRIQNVFLPKLALYGYALQKSVQRFSTAHFVEILGWKLLVAGIHLFFNKMKQEQKCILCSQEILEPFRSSVSSFYCILYRRK